MNNNYKEFPKKVDSTTVVLNTIFNLASVGSRKVPFSDIEEQLVKIKPDTLEVEKEVRNGLLFASLYNYIVIDKEKRIVHITISKEDAEEKLNESKALVLVKK
ncbi:MAG TPA: hypothetical protein PKY25_03225 [Bacilli bacterium]|nr:hypothetical protein [Bacilli bacterium]